MTQLIIDSEQLDQLILQRLPTLMGKNLQIQELVLNLARQKFADRKETDDRFYQLLGELKRDREEQAHKWDEQNRKWDEQNRKWDETQKEFQRVHEDIAAMTKKLDRSITALGARWGIKSEKTFRNALAGILEKNFGVQVLNITDYDNEGVRQGI